MATGYEGSDPEYTVDKPRTVIYFMICRLCRRMLAIYPTGEGVFSLDMYNWTGHYERHNISRSVVSYKNDVIKIKLKRCDNLCRMIDLEQEEKRMNTSKRF